MVERTPLELDRERVTCLLLVNTQLMKKIINIYTNFLTNQQMLLQLPPQNKQSIIELYQNCTRRLHCNLLVLTYINEKYHSDPSQPLSQQQNRPQFPIIILPPQEMPELTQLYNKLQELYPEAVQFLRVKLQQLRKGQIPSAPLISGPESQLPQIVNQNIPQQHQQLPQQPQSASSNQLPHLDYGVQNVSQQNLAQNMRQQAPHHAGQNVDSLSRQFSPQQNSFNVDFPGANFDLERQSMTPGQQSQQSQQSQRPPSQQQLQQQLQMMGNISPQLLTTNQPNNQSGNQVDQMGQMNQMQMNQIQMNQMNQMGQMNQINQINLSGNQSAFVGGAVNVNGGIQDSGNDYLNGMMDFFNV